MHIGKSPRKEEPKSNTLYSYSSPNIPYLQSTNLHRRKYLIFLHRLRKLHQRPEFHLIQTRLAMARMHIPQKQLECLCIELGDAHLLPVDWGDANWETTGEFT